MQGSGARMLLPSAGLSADEFGVVAEVHNTRAAIQREQDDRCLGNCNETRKRFTSGDSESDSGARGRCESGLTPGRRLAFLDP